MRLARSERRKEVSDHTRITLLEDDADETEQQQYRFEAKLDSIRNWLVTSAITFAASAVLLGINVALR